MVTELPEAELKRWVKTLGQLTEHDQTLWKRRGDIPASAYALVFPNPPVELNRPKRVLYLDQHGSMDTACVEVVFGTLKEVQEPGAYGKKKEIICPNFRQVVGSNHLCRFDYLDLYKRARESWEKTGSERDALIRDFDVAVAAIL